MNRPFKIGAKVICNTVGHHTSSMIGYVDHYCTNDDPEDTALGLCEGYMYLDNGYAVNVSQCVELPKQVTVTLTQQQIDTVLYAFWVYRKECAITEDTLEYSEVKEIENLLLKQREGSL